MNLVQYNLLKSISMIKLSNFGHKCAYTVKLEILQYYAYYYIMCDILEQFTAKVASWHNGQDQVVACSF